MRIIHLTKFVSPYRGGIERATFEMASASVRMGATVDIVGCLDQSGMAEPMPGVTITPISNFLSLGPAPVTSGYLRALPALREADIVHLHLPNPIAEMSLSFFRGDWQSRAKLVPVYHAPILRGGRFGRLWQHSMYQKIAELSDQIIVPTPQLFENLRELKRFANRVHFLPYRVEPDAPAFPKPVTDGVFSMLAVGRLVHYKGLHVLLDALKGVEGNWKLEIVENGPLRSELERQAKALKISERIQFHGNVDERTKLEKLHGCDLFVFPSCLSSEAFGIAAAEAFYFGKPAILTNLPTGVRFLARGGSCGALVAPNDPRSLRDAIRSLMQDELRRKKCGEDNRKFWLENLSEKAYDRAYLSVLNRALGISEKRAA